MSRSFAWSAAFRSVTAASASFCVRPEYLEGVELLQQVLFERPDAVPVLALLLRELDARVLALLHLFLRSLLLGRLLLLRLLPHPLHVVLHLLVDLLCLARGLPCTAMCTSFTGWLE